MKFCKTAIILLVLASTFLLAAIGTITAVGTFTGTKYGPPKNYQFLLDVSRVKNSQNSTGLPDARDGGRLKDFFAIYQSNYCSGRVLLNTTFIDFCSKSGKQLFDYTDHDWEDYGVDFSNVTGTVPKRLVKRKGGGGGGRGGGGGGKSSSKSSSKAGSKAGAVKSGSSPARTTKAKALSRTSGARPVYAVTFGPTYHYRLWAMVVAFAVVGISCAIFAIFWSWCAVLAAVFAFMACVTSIALAADPKKELTRYSQFLKNYRGSNDTSISLKIGTVPFLLTWVAFALLGISTILWCLCFWFMIKKKSAPKTVIAEHDAESVEQSNSEYIDDVKAKEAPTISQADIKPKQSLMTKIKSIPLALLSPKMNQTSNYSAIDSAQRQDTGYVSPSTGAFGTAPPAYVEQAPQTAFEPMRSKSQ